MMIITARYSWHVVDLENYEVTILILEKTIPNLAKSDLIHG